MTQFPRRSSDVLVAPLGEVSVAYDLATEVAHVVNASAGRLLASCDGYSDVDHAVTAWSVMSGATRATVARDVTACLEALTGLGLVSRETALDPLAQPQGSSVLGPDRFGAVHAVLDHGIRFRGTQPFLIDAIDTFLAMADGGRAPTIEFDVVRDAAGRVLLTTESEWSFPSVEGCLEQLPTVINEYATRSHSCVVLHAGAVRSPAGSTVLLPGRSGAGKSTLTAALIQSGWDYLSDEAVGIRSGSLNAVSYAKPLALDGVSREALGLAGSRSLATSVTELRPDTQRIGGDSDPIALVVLPEFVSGAVVDVALLEPAEAIMALIGHTTNLRRVGQDGLEAVCAVATTVPVHRLIHGGHRHAAKAIEDLVAAL